MSQIELTTELTSESPTTSPAPAAPVSVAQDLADTIAEFEQYRARLVSETLTTAQRAKMTKAATMAQLEPELAKIDHALQTLRDQQAASIS